VIAPEKLSIEEVNQFVSRDALRIAAAEREAFHEKILRLRALREAAEAEKALQQRISNS
jgi:hypothetical protein